MPTLLVIRHAAAEDRDPARWPDDADRPLTGKGERRFSELLETLDLPALSSILSSRHARAWKTAEVLSDHVGGSAERCAALEEQGVDAMLQAARSALGRGVFALAMVGHEPFMSAFAGELLGAPGHPATLRFRKGAIASLEVEPSLELGRASLNWFVSPGVVGR
jgi:phosphohistidine phosphatase SixA